MKDTGKIAVACFVGGALCSTIALMFAPIYWWFGLIAGLAGGYVGYEFREFCGAIVVASRSALRVAWRGSACFLRFLGWMIEEKIVETRVWLSEPHYFFYPAAIVTMPLIVWIFSNFIFEMRDFFVSTEVSLLIKMIHVPASFAILVSFLVMMLFLATVLLFTLAFIGARVGERCYWKPFVLTGAIMEESYQRELEERGYRRKPLTYLNVLRWTLLFVPVVIRFLAWTVWKYIAIGVRETLSFFGRFVWHLFKLVHSEKRVLCAVDGTLGGAISYIWFAKSAVSFPEQAVLLVFGGMLGAAFGVLNWEIVSKRILHIAPAKSA